MLTSEQFEQRNGYLLIQIVQSLALLLTAAVAPMHAPVEIQLSDVGSRQLRSGPMYFLTNEPSDLLRAALAENNLKVMKAGRVDT